MNTVADWLNARSAGAARAALLRCCAAPRWADAMTAARPYANDAAVIERARTLWWERPPAEWREAFAAHPRIGGRADGAWSADEQRGMDDADARLRADLHAANEAYEARFGHVFLICASGLSAEAMYAAVRSRMDNGADDELRIAAGEQMRITELRLRKLVNEVSGITTHVLDTQAGRPASGVSVTLTRIGPDGGRTPLGGGTTDDDGRVSDLGPAARALPAGTYALRFETGAYFDALGQATFYPWAEVAFEVSGEAHYHVPLLLSAFGYSTYRGS